MSIQETDVVETTKTPAKRKSITLSAGAGDKLVRLTILARRTPGDGGQTAVTTTDAKGKATRGMTATFDTFDLAVEALGKLAQDAMRKGWQKSERAGGFKARPDAFTTMPVAPKVTK